MEGYLSLEKFTDLWSVYEHDDILNKTIFRKLGSYFVREQLVCAMLTSKRMMK